MSGWLIWVLWKAMTAGMGMSMLVLTACSAQPTGTVQIPDVVYVQNVDEKESENTISVTGRETVEVIPDMAQISFSVSTEHKDAKTCQQNNTEDPVEYTGTEKADTASLLPRGIHNDIPADFACFYS